MASRTTRRYSKGCRGLSRDSAGIAKKIGSSAFSCCCFAHACQPAFSTMFIPGVFGMTISARSHLMSRVLGCHLPFTLFSVWRQNPATAPCGTLVSACSSTMQLIRQRHLSLGLWQHFSSTLQDCASWSCMLKNLKGKPVVSACCATEKRAINELHKEMASRVFTEMLCVDMAGIQAKRLPSIMICFLRLQATQTVCV